MKSPARATINKILLYCFAISLCIFPGTIFPVQGNNDNNSTNLTLLANQLGQENQKISNDIIKGNYPAARESSANLLKGLEELIEVFIPLPDRIKRLVLAERKIADKISQIGMEKLPPSTQPKKDIPTITETQNTNLRATKKTAQLISQQLNTQTQKGNKEQKIEEQKLKKLLTEVRKLILTAAETEKKTLNLLQKKEFSQAQPEAVTASKLLEEALNKFQKKNQQNQKSSSQDQQKKDGSKNQQDKNEQTKKQQQKKDTNAHPPAKQKMTPQEALKKLAQIQKRDRKELKDREKKYGKLKLPVQIPAEKDW